MFLFVLPIVQASPRNRWRRPTKDTSEHTIVERRTYRVRVWNIANLSPRLELHNPEIRRPRSEHPDECQVWDARVPRQNMKQNGLNRVAVHELALLKYLLGKKPDFRA